MKLLYNFTNAIGHNFLRKNIFQSKERGCKQVVSSSGGNAGMASAYVAKMLGLPATIVIPESTPKLMISRLEEEEAKVMVRSCLK